MIHMKHEVVLNIEIKMTLWVNVCGVFPAVNNHLI